MKLFRRIKCLLGMHSYTVVKRQWGNLQVSQCDFCTRHLNVHRGLQHAFESSEKGSLLQEIEGAKQLFPEKGNK